MSRVLVVAPQPFFAARGTPLSVYYRTLVMAEQGAEIDLLTYGTGVDVSIPGVRLIRIPRLPFTKRVPVGPSVTKAILDVPMMVWTLALLLRRGYDVVHAHEESVFWCHALKPLFRFRLVYDMHSSLPQQLANFSYTSSPLLVRMFEALERRAARLADVVITVCPELRNHALGLGVDSARELLIENSIFDEVRIAARHESAQPGELPPGVAFDGGQRTVLYAGTFEPYQGIDLLMNAFAEVARRLPDVRLLLLGGREEQVRDARAYAESLGLGARVAMTGTVPKPVATHCLQRADVVVSPRLRGNNTPLKIYEQLACGKPLVATRILSHTQVLDESTSFLTDPDAESMAAAIVEALTDRVAAEQRVRNARALYEREYSRDVYEDKIRRLLEMIA